MIAQSVVIDWGTVYPWISKVGPMFSYIKPLYYPCQVGRSDNMVMTCDDHQKKWGLSGYHHVPLKPVQSHPSAVTVARFWLATQRLSPLYGG